VEFGHGSATPGSLRRLIVAVQKRDPWRFQKAWGALSHGERQAVSRHIELRWSVRSGMSEWATPLIVAGAYFHQDDDEFWIVALEVLARRLAAASGRRRPRDLCRDRIALELARTWSGLAGKPVTIPRAEDGSSELRGAMIDFVRDAAKVFPEIRISFNSTASWARILRPELSQKT
jgi:hypothetical protein